MHREVMCLLYTENDVGSSPTSATKLMPNVKFNWLNKSQLQNAITSSMSRSQVLQKLGLKPNGGNHRTLKKYASEYRFTLPQFTPISGFQQIFSLEEILVENSTYLDSTYLKYRLIRENILENVCAGCGNIGIWQGKPLTLQLEHKNGIHSDNRIENLTLLCPNCHTQTKTWGAKSRNTEE